MEKKKNPMDSQGLGSHIKIIVIYFWGYINLLGRLY